MIRAILIMTLTGTTLAATAGDAAAQWRYRARGAWGVGVTPYWGTGVYYSYGYPRYGYYGSPYYTYGYSTFSPSYAYDSAQNYIPPTTSTSSYTPQNGVAQAGYTTAGDSQFKATLTVLLPSADADIWLGDTRTITQGMERKFESPALEPGRDYHYTVKARWMVDGKPVEQTRVVPVHAGQSSTVNFRDAISERIPQPDKK
jgi:uncharacterized protein (TIGR03000 family)